jgi:hypothetical protein
MLEALRVDVVGAGERMHLIDRGIGAVVRMQPLSDCLGIQDGGDLEVAMSEAIYSRLHYAL